MASVETPHTAPLPNIASDLIPVRGRSAQLGNLTAWLDALDMLAPLSIECTVRDGFGRQVRCFTCASLRMSSGSPYFLSLVASVIL